MNGVGGGGSYQSLSQMSLFDVFFPGLTRRILPSDIPHPSRATEPIYSGIKCDRCPKELTGS